VKIEELGNLSATSPGLATVQLILSEDSQAVEKAQDLIQRVRGEIPDASQQRELLQLIESVLIYKLPRLSRQEIEAMFTLSDLKQTRFYQEAFEVGVDSLDSFPHSESIHFI
jgi:predicted transposase YdaD